MSVGRNDPCPCGSGKKYKKCCLAAARAARASDGAKPPDTGADLRRSVTDALAVFAPRPELQAGLRAAVRLFDDGRLEARSERERASLTSSDDWQVKLMFWCLFDAPMNPSGETVAQAFLRLEANAVSGGLAGVPEDLVGIGLPAVYWKAVGTELRPTSERAKVGRVPRGASPPLLIPIEDFVVLVRPEAWVDPWPPSDLFWINREADRVVSVEACVVTEGVGGRLPGPFPPSSEPVLGLLSSRDEIESLGLDWRTKAWPIRGTAGSTSEAASKVVILGDGCLLVRSFRQRGRS